MELRHLRYFIAAVEEGSLQKAAARLNIAQPALSRRVRDLEVELGCPLFLRGPRGIVPTPAGRLLYEDGIRAVAGLEETIQRVRQSARLGGDGVRLGLAPSVARKYAFVADVLEREQADSGYRIAIVQRPSSELADSLRKGTIDLALMYEQRPNARHIGERLIHREAYVLAMHPSHRLAIRAPADLSELADQPLVWLSRRDSAGGVNPMLLQLRRHGFDPSIRELVDTPEEQLDLTMTGAGMCITPASTMLAVPPGKLHFRALPRLDAAMDLTMAWHREGSGEHSQGLVARVNAAIDRHRSALAQLPDWAMLDKHQLYRPE